MGYLSNVRPNERFILKGGESLRNIVELASALKSMDQETFSHHVNTEKNDFAAWVSHSVKDQVLAEKLKYAYTPETAYLVISGRIKELVPDPDRPRPWTELPPGGIDKIRSPGFVSNEEAIHDIELLASSFSEESFIRAYHEGKFTLSTKGSDDLVKESDAGIVVLRKNDVKTNWGDNHKDLPLFSLDAPKDSPGLPDKKTADFFQKLTMLQEHVSNKEKHPAKMLYTELKRDFSSQQFDAKDKKSIHALLSTAYHDIMSLS
jgi:hypothetical protein